MDKPNRSNEGNPPPGLEDPYVYANLVNSLVTDRNPFQLLAAEIRHKLKLVFNLRKNRELAQERIDQLQQQVDKVESAVAKVTPKTTGNHFDKLR